MGQLAEVTAAEFKVADKKLERPEILLQIFDQVIFERIRLLQG